MFKITLAEVVPGLDQHPHFSRLDEIFQRSLINAEKEAMVEAEQDIGSHLAEEVAERKRRGKFRQLVDEKVTQICDCAKDQYQAFLDEIELKSQEEEAVKNEYTDELKLNKQIKDHEKRLVQDHIRKARHEGRKLDKGQAIGELRANGAMLPKDTEREVKIEAYGLSEEGFDKASDSVQKESHQLNGQSEFVNDNEEPSL